MAVRKAWMAAGSVRAAITETGGLLMLPEILVGGLAGEGGEGTSVCAVGPDQQLLDGCGCLMLQNTRLVF